MVQNSFRKSKIKMFVAGFFVGMLVSILVMAGFVQFVLRHPNRVLVKAVDMGMNRVVEKTVNSIPRNYIGQRQEDIARSARTLASAYSEDKITPAEMNLLAKQMFSAIADQQLTMEEIDQMLQMINRFSQ